MINATLKLIGCADGTTGLFVTVNGRQALAEGPRRVAYCVYCKAPCRRSTAHCEARVYAESLKGGATQPKP